MVVLFILIGIFSITTMFLKLFKQQLNYLFAARVALAFMLLFTAISHFIYTEGMQLMLPNWIPYKKKVILISGFIEIMFAILICLQRLRKIAAWSLIAFLILILPANIQATLRQVDIQNATYFGPGITYLWFRIPLQFFLIGWTYWCCLSKKVSL